MTSNPNPAQSSHAPPHAASARSSWLIGAAAVVAAGFGGYAINGATSASRQTPTATAAALTQLPWVAAAPGRVEPKTGEVRITAGILGRVTDVFVAVNDKVEDGELLIRLDDDEARARLASAEAEAGARRRERDAQAVTAGREDVRRAEDAVYSAGRAVTGARFELDYALTAKRKGKGSNVDQALAEARRRLNEAQERLQREQVALAGAQSKAGIPAPNRLESALTAARADVEVAESLLDKTRVRSPISGTVLQLMAKTGELVAPSPEQPLVVLGDMSVMRVKAELDERDVAKVKVGQKAFVRSDSYAGRDFEGRVSALAPSLAAPRIGARGPRRPNDVEVLEVTIDLEGAVPLLPGMRVDAFFRRD
jgi:HlyD family secretion protein